MSLADDLEQAAHTLRRAAQQYTTTSTSFFKQSQGLGGLVEGLVTGPDRWAGLSSDAFQTSWSRTKEDSSRVQVALAVAAGYLNSLVTTLEAQAPIIRSAQSIQQSASSMPNTTQQEVQDVHQTVQQAIQQEQNALGVIAMMVSQMSEKLDEASRDIGICSTGNNKKGSPFGDLIAPATTGEGAAEQEIVDALVAQGMDPADAAELAQLIIMLAEEQGANPEDIAALLKEGISFDQIEQ